MPFIYDETIPAANNNPSSDQPVMQANALAITQLIAVDHVTFNSADSGKHEQVTFVDKNTPAAQTDPQSVLYTANGVANTKADLKFVNQNATFPLNSLRAFGLFSLLNGTPPTITTIGTQSFNIASASGINLTGSIARFTVTLSANVTTGNDVGIVLSKSFTDSTSSVNYFGQLYSFAAGVLTFDVLRANLTIAQNITILFYQL
jgi:hypothetical protein